ncbi:MAG: hypothetical protein Q8L47_03835 [bacterium]|nr:hypothetical protein [bacterium]
MKKNVLIISFILIFSLLAFGYAQQKIKVTSPDGTETVIEIPKDSEMIPNNVEDITIGAAYSRELNLTTATSSPIYVATSTEPTTLTMDISDLETIDLNLQVVSSSTVARIDWRYEFSNDKIDWFGEDSKTITSDVITTHGAATTTHYWTPATIKTVRKNVAISNTNANWLKISFSRGTTNDGNYSLWANLKGLPKGY